MQFSRSIIISRFSSLQHKTSWFARTTFSNLNDPISSASSVNHGYFFKSLSTSPHIQTEDTTASSSSHTVSSTSTQPSPVKVLPSILTDPNVTSGKIWYHLQREKIGPQKDISVSEWTTFVSVSKPNTPSEARLLRTALLDLNRCCKNFKITRTMAKDVFMSMIRSSMPDDNDDVDVSGIQYHKQQLETGIFVGNVFLDKRTRLYMSLETQVLNQYLLEPLWKTIQQIQTLQQQENQQDINGVSLEHDIEGLYTSLLPVITGMMDVLYERCSKPMRQMKKRAARLYKRKLSCTQGPTPETIDLAIRLYVEMYKQKKEEAEVTETTKLATALTTAQQMMHELEKRKWLGIPLDSTKQYLSEQQQ